jgi:MaoC like domain
VTADATQEVESPPGVASLYAGAILGAVLPGGGDELPDRSLVLSDVEIDREHLTAYDRVCGFRVSDELPITYPHVLAFPLSLKLMTDRSFPFSLLGLVHVSNRIDQQRPLRADERPTLRVRAEDLRPHPKGRQFDLVAEAEVDGTNAWTGRSTYLRRGGDGSGEKSKQDSGDCPEPGEPAAVWKVPADIGRRYAAVSGDRNPIHLHSVSARLFGVRGPIAHGMWMKARCLAALEGRLSEASRAEVKFTSQLRLPSEVRLASAREDGGWTFALCPSGEDRPYLTGLVAPLG